MKNTISTQLKPVEIFFYGDNRNRLKIIAISIQGADDRQMFNTNFYITHLNTYCQIFFYTLQLIIITLNLLNTSK